MKNLLIFFSVVILLGCSKRELSTYDEMKSDELLSSSFSGDELKDLAQVVDFFEDQMRLDVKKNLSTLKLYQFFLKKDSTTYLKGAIHEFIDYKKQEKIYENIDSSFFNNLWGKGGGTNFYGDEKEYKYTCHHLKVYKSKYSKFIQEFSKTNKFIKEYYESAESTGDFFNPVSPIRLTLYYRKFDFDDVKIRLVFALHYLNINESNINPRNEMLKSLNKNKKNNQ